MVLQFPKEGTVAFNQSMKEAARLAKVDETSNG
jgi:hypothetical protein